MSLGGNFKKPEQDELAVEDLMLHPTTRQLVSPALPWRLAGQPVEEILWLLTENEPRIET